MKRNKTSLIIVIALLIFSVYLIVNNSTSTFKSEYKDFAIKDTASITKIFLSDKKNSNVLLVRQDTGKWMLNNKFSANIGVVNTLLKTLENIAVNSPVPKAAYNNVVSRMSATAIKVEIYQNVYRINLFDKIKLFRHEKLTKTYYVGGETKDLVGTYMLIEGSQMPFVTYLPNFRGYLTSRFTPLESVWRDQTVFSYRLKNIKSVKMDFPATPDSSFIINETGNLKYSLTTVLGNKAITYDTIKLLKYLSAFQNLKYEALITDMKKNKKDSIVSSRPWHILSVTDNKGKTVKIKTFIKKYEAGEGSIDEITNKPVIYDRDRLYALINDDRDFALIQFYTFDKILKSVNYFKKN